MELQENLESFEYPDLGLNSQDTSANTLDDELLLNDNNRIVYKVYFSKLDNKKINPLKPGILIASFAKLELKDENSETVAENLNTLNTITFQVDQVIRIGTFEIDIEKQFPISNSKIKIREECKSAKAKKVIKSYFKSTNTPQSPLEPTQKLSIPFGAFILDESKRVFIEKRFSDSLRDYQKEGIEFMYNCVSGKRSKNELGCILADHMGLGKTLTSLSLIYAVTRKGCESEIKKVLIITPASLLENWSKEIQHWFNDKISFKILGSGYKQNDVSINRFKSGQVNCLLIGYEFFNSLKGKINKEPDLVICDEGHRLKNHNTLTYKSIMEIKTTRKIILTGTPLQNNINDFYHIVNIVNSNVLGSWEAFRIRYADPILRAQTPDATIETIQAAENKSKEIWSKTQNFVLRRTAEKIYAKLPPRNEYIVFYSLLSLQEELYLSYLGSDIVEEVNNDVYQTVFPLITALKKITTHPDLIFYRGNKENSLEKEHSRASKLFPQDYQACKDRSGYSLKLKFTLELISRACDCSEKVIVGSYWNKALDIVKTALDVENYLVFKINGSTPAVLRTKIIDQFNDCRDFAVLLLNCKAGGTGLNIVGASRMILFDADWNPKNDSQAMGRIWRPGQDKEVHIYRLIGIGTIEEKIYERQISKENLSLHLIDRYAISKLDSKFIKQLFRYCPKQSTFSSLDSINSSENSWLDILSPYFSSYKKVQAEWEKLKDEDCILSNPSSDPDSLKVDWEVSGMKKLLNE